MKVVSAFQLLFLLLENSSPTPIFVPTADVPLGPVPVGWCRLFPELDLAGTLQFLEDCNSTERCPEFILMLACTYFDCLDLSLCLYQRRWSKSWESIHWSAVQNTSGGKCD